MRNIQQLIYDLLLSANYHLCLNVMLKIIIDMPVLVLQYCKNELIQSNVLSINGKNRKKC